MAELVGVASAAKKMRIPTGTVQHWVIRTPKNKVESFKKELALDTPFVPPVARENKDVFFGFGIGELRSWALIVIFAQVISMILLMGLLVYFLG